MPRKTPPQSKPAPQPEPLRPVIDALIKCADTAAAGKQGTAIGEALTRLRQIDCILALVRGWDGSNASPHLRAAMADVLAALNKADALGE